MNARIATRTAHFLRTGPSPPSRLWPGKNGGDVVSPRSKTTAEPTPADILGPDGAIARAKEAPKNKLSVSDYSMLGVVVQREMERPRSGDKVDWTFEQKSAICRLRANPEGKERAASCRPPSVLAPGTALGACRHGALSSARAAPHHRAVGRPRQRHGGHQLAGRFAWRAARLRSRAASSLRSRSAKIAASRLASLSAGAT